jgi:hypothetical protein
MNFNLEQQLQWKIIFDSERDLDSEGKLRKIKFSEKHGSLFTCFYQNKTPKIMVRIDLSSFEGMYYTHKVPVDCNGFTVDHEDPNKIWLICENEVEGITLKKRNNQLVENDFNEGENREVLVYGRNKIEGFSIGPNGDCYYVSENNYIKKYGLTKNELLCTFEGHAFEIEKMVFSDDMRYLIR